VNSIINKFRKHSKLEHIFALLPGIFGFVLLAGLSPACAQNVVIENRQSITVPGNYGSPWNISGDLTVGEHHAGELTIENSGVVSTGFQGRTGYFSGSSGSGTVTGAGSQWNMGDLLLIGHEGSE